MDKALLVGINNYPTSPLRGCVNDITDVAKLLVEKFDVRPDDIRLLVDERATTLAIINRLGWLLTGVRSGDRILFYYTGHGIRLPIRNPQGEVDGLDEAICPVDFDWTEEHAIRDKQFNRIFSAVPAGVEFVWVSDSCHSAGLTKSIMENQVIEKTFVPPADIQWRIDVAESKQIVPLTLKKSVENLNVALISGCMSDQTSADYIFNGRANGVLSYYLIDELKTSEGQSESLIEVVKKVCLKLNLNGYTQIPQLEGSNIIQNKTFLSR